MMLFWLPGELAVVCSALLGGSLAFLWYNAHPRKCSWEILVHWPLEVGRDYCLMVHQPFTLVIVGGIFVMEEVLSFFGYPLRPVEKEFFDVSNSSSF